MTAEGNLWQLTWESCRALSAEEQTPLFKCEKEAAKVFHYFDNITPSVLMEQIVRKYEERMTVISLI